MRSFGAAFILVGLILPGQAQQADCSYVRTALTMFSPAHLCAMATPSLKAKYQHCLDCNALPKKKPKWPKRRE